MPNRFVVKFGGGSLRTGADIAKAARLVADEARKGTQIVVVVSAMGETTDRLTQALSEATSGKASPEELDSVLAMGERIASRIFSAAVKAQGVMVELIDVDQPNWPIITDGQHTCANPMVDACAERVKSFVVPLLERGVIVIIPGFVGITEQGSITTLGRGGSDTTALLIANLVNASEVIFVTEVGGILTADPKLVADPELISELTVDELIGLADVGSKFIHSKALKFKSEKFDIRVISNVATSLREKGSTVKGSFPELKVELYSPEPLASITIVGRELGESPGVMAELLNAAKDSGAAVVGMSSDPNSVILYLKPSREVLNRLHEVVKSRPQAISMSVRRGLALIRVKGVGLEEKPGIIGSISKPLREEGINIFGMFTVTSSVFLLVDWEERERAIRLVEDALGI